MDFDDESLISRKYPMEYRSFWSTSPHNGSWTIHLQFDNINNKLWISNKSFDKMECFKYAIVHMNLIYTSL